MQPIQSILDVAHHYDTIVFDQWGVLHNGTMPYPDAVATIDALQGTDTQLCVLSNSGKHADVNEDRITGMGFTRGAFDVVMTSGEALRIEMQKDQARRPDVLFPITAAQGDAETWAKGLSLQFTDDLEAADAILLMGLPDAADHQAERAILAQARSLGKHLICSNPDRASPRADGQTVESPGALAHAYADAGGMVTFYGKPYQAIYDIMAPMLRAAVPERVLMVGDSPEHDIAGAVQAGWHSLFIAGGLHADTSDDLFDDRMRPNYILPTLR